ncbi:MAG TPA: hypothetical protein VH702_14240 [Vicinamibacterales bacterium]
MILYVVFGIILAIATWVVVRLRRGHLAASALVSFERSYEDAYRGVGSERGALRQAFKAFAVVPKIRELREDDIDVIVEIVGAADDPKRVIREIIMRLSASNALEAFRNRGVLTDLAAATSKAERARIEGPHLRLAEDAFGVAHEWVGLRAELNAEAGTLASVARNLSRTVNYDQFERRAGELKGRIETLATSVAEQVPDGPSAEADFHQLLSEYLDSLSVAATIFAEKTAFLAKKARSAAAPGTTWSDFTRITRDEETSLARCQDTGDRLTRVYKRLSG